MDKYDSYICLPLSKSVVPIQRSNEKTLVVQSNKQDSLERKVRFFSWLNLDVSENSGTPKSSILIGFSIIFIIHFGGTPIFGNTHLMDFWCKHFSTPNRTGLESAYGLKGHGCTLEIGNGCF